MLNVCMCFSVKYIIHCPLLTILWVRNIRNIPKKSLNNCK